MCERGDNDPGAGFWVGVSVGEWWWLKVWNDKKTAKKAKTVKTAKIVKKPAKFIHKNEVFKSLQLNYSKWIIKNESLKMNY